MSKRKCYACGCGSSKTRDWCSNGITNQFLCKKCYTRYITNPISNPNRSKALIKSFNERRIKFGQKVIYIEKNPRKGKCQRCHKKGPTHMHHEKFGLFPLDNTMELCYSCHTKRGWELGQYASS
jgi:hypothetical protein